jgi:formylglycine-generating enzyme required for sulfatase activity/uncharacterized caspase-like protein
MAKIALLVGVRQYEPGFSPLPGAAKDVAALRQVLENPQIGGFDSVHELLDPEPSIMQEAIELAFADRTKDDLVLLFFSGHGVKDDQSRLYFATPRTRKNDRGELIKSTAVSASVIHDFMSNSRAKRQVVILDCCFSGAFAIGMPAKTTQTEDISADIRAQLGAEGRAVLTSSTATQYSFEQPNGELSVYTRYLVEGLKTGAADQDSDGEISVDEMHEYARSKVQEAAPAMKPEIYAVREGYKIKLARAPVGDPRLVYRKEVEELVRSSNGEISYLDRSILDAQKSNLGLPAEVASAIEAEVLKPYQERRQKLGIYEQAWREVVQRESAVGELTRDKLKRLQQALKLRDEDVEPIEKASPLLQTPPTEPASPVITRQQFLTWAGVGGGGLVVALLASQIFQNPRGSEDQKPPQLQKSPQLLTSNFEVVTVNDQGQIAKRDTRQATFFKEDLGGGIVLEMVSIPGGEFLMGTATADRETIIRERTRHGTTQKDAETWTNWEMPQHRVKLAGFYMGKFAVTQAQWERVAGLPKIKVDLNPDPSNFKGAKRPVEKVSWDEAVEFCDRLSRQTGRTYRLPSEAEWEYACRAGTTTPFHFGATITTDLVNCNGTNPFGNAPRGEYGRRTTDVGSFSANAFGLYDMHGNVWEWCADPWHETYQGAPTDGSVWKGGNSNLRLLRGGSWDYDPVDCRSAARLRLLSGLRNYYFGFRVVAVLA